MNIDNIRMLMRQFTDAAPFVDAYCELEDGEWGCECGEIRATINFDSEEQRLTLRSALGNPSSSSRLSVYTALLAISGQTRRFGGIRMALDKASGEVIQECDVLLESLDTNKLVRAAEDFCEKARIVVDFIRGAEAGQTAETISPRDLEQFALRV